MLWYHEKKADITKICIIKYKFILIKWKYIFISCETFNFATFQQPYKTLFLNLTSNKVAGWVLQTSLKWTPLTITLRISFQFLSMPDNY